MSAQKEAAIKDLRLKRNEERRLAAGHLWVFSNEVDTAATPLSTFAVGELCRVVSARDKFMGYAYVNPHSLISARVMSRGTGQLPDAAWLRARLQAALGLRQRLYDRPYYRWVYGETDGLPGLVLDRFGDVIVGQIGTAGMEARKAEIQQAVAEVLSPTAMVWKNDSGARDLEGLPLYVEAAFGEVPESMLVEEGGVSFQVPATGGQKTGWFFDQAANRQLLRKYVKGARVLDVFSYVGAWGLGALAGGASEVTCVDSSAAALGFLEQSATANSLKPEVIRGDAFDVLEELATAGRKFDVVVVDPPAFIKRKKDVPKGEAAYRRINQLALKLLDREGILVSCSCSYHMTADALMGEIQHAARQTSRLVQVLEVGGQAPDHPIHPAIVETRYLKAFFCRVLKDSA